jgi:NADH dehydrogenase [ubiquinone] 1 alpha subcomplex assembly factor 7
MQELFDALPVNQFQFTHKGWRERLVDINDTTPPGVTNEAPTETRSNANHRLRLVLAPGPTPASIAFTAARAEHFQTHPPTIGDFAEFSPASMAVMKELVSLVSSSKGAGLIIDYGDMNISKPTIRAIKQHAFVDLLQEPGEADLSADVDFAVLKSIAGATMGLEVLGPVKQRDFLIQMGIAERINALLAKAANDTVRERLVSEANRLCDAADMGSVYKVMGLESSITTGGHPVPGFLV